LCIWLLSFHDGVVEAFSTARVVPPLVDVVKSSTKEKAHIAAARAQRTRFEESCSFRYNFSLLACTFYLLNVCNCYI
ncbi:hypothetical protein M758_UG261500, partial [Ceratodon purpureus]